MWRIDKDCGDLWNSVDNGRKLVDQVKVQWGSLRLSVFSRWIIRTCIQKLPKLPRLSYTDTPLNINFPARTPVSFPFLIKSFFFYFFSCFPFLPFLPSLPFFLFFLLFLLFLLFLHFPLFLYTPVVGKPESVTCQSGLAYHVPRMLTCHSAFDLLSQRPHSRILYFL